MERATINEVQAALAAFPGLDAVFVAEQESESAGPCLVAWVAPGGVDMPALHAHARKHLPGWLIPAVIMPLDMIPGDADGRAGPPLLPAPDLSALVPYRPPETARQETLCDIFAEVLRVPRFGVDDDFFNLGARSVDAMLLAARISAALGTTMPMADLFDAPTVTELDRRLGGKETDVR